VRRLHATALVSVIVLGTASPAAERPAQRAAASESRAARGAATVVAVGDIARRGSPSLTQAATASLAASLEPDAVLVLGDAQYDVGAYSDFLSSYDVTWGQLLDRTHPVPGNHEYLTEAAEGFFRYFGDRIPGTTGYYSFDVGAWHVVALNSYDGERPPAAELEWLEADLAADDHLCQLAYWHHPRWSSGAADVVSPPMSAFWDVLYRYGVEVALNGHDHLYERFARLRPSGVVAPDGIRQFTVGTGGKSLFEFGPAVRGSRVRIRAFGVLQLLLRPARYRWSFERITGATPDLGSTPCHGATPRA
jgi:hypothetical protein